MTCDCCRRRDADHCRCVYSTCRRCLMCLTHCGCPERHARGCQPDPALDDPAGPFGGLDVPPTVPGDPPLFRVAEALCVVRRAFAADFLAVAWVRHAPLPDGRWALQFGGWCQGVGTADHPWAAYPTRAEGLARFLAAAGDLCIRPVPGGLDRVQETARKRLLAKLTVYEREPR